MFPDIFRIGDFALHTYGLLIAIGIVSALWIVRRECDAAGLDGGRVIDILFWGIWAGIIGSRLWYVAYFPAEFAENPLDVIKIWKGGLVFHGGILTAIPVILLLLKKHGLPLLRTFDAASIGVPLAHFFGRLGCFAAGCCYGRECDLPWAVMFSHPGTIAPRGVPLHPVQLYESFLNLALFAALYATRKRLTREGIRIGLYLAAYGVIRFVVELFRGDPRGIHGSLSSAQWISVGFLLAGALLLARAFRRPSTASRS